MPLNPSVITPDVSINQVVVMHAPDLPDALKGKTAYQLVSRKYLAQTIETDMPDLMTHPDPIPVFDTLLGQRDPRALKLADQFALRFFWFIHTLKFPHPDNQQARPNWDESYWAFFANLKQFIFGGGLMRGNIGKHMVAYTQARLGDACKLIISPYAPILSTLGAARHLPDDTQKALIFDFGETAIKRAIATYQMGILTHIHVLPTIPAPPFTGEAQPDMVADTMVRVITQTWGEFADDQTALMIPVSISTYLNGQNPFGDNYYGAILSLATTETPTNIVLSRRVAAQIGRDVTIYLIHDGASAGRVYVGEPDTIVITSGTAFGIGFPVYDAPLRPIADRLIIN